MGHTPTGSKISISFDAMVLTDKRGRTVFFPWGSNRTGYYVYDLGLIASAKRFYTLTFTICVCILSIVASINHTFWGIIGSMIVCFGGWFVVYYLRMSRLVESLPVADEDYRTIMLEKLEADYADEADSLEG